MIVYSVQLDLSGLLSERTCLFFSPCLRDLRGVVRRSYIWSRLGRKDTQVSDDHLYEVHLCSPNENNF
jgi:hypothetical protein